MNRIASLRRAAKLSQRQLAERMAVRVETVSRWERGKNKISDEDKLTLASLFGVSVGFLMGWDEPNGGNGDNGESEVA
jgi:transcriptional regulator with XRE-family HTH domain